MVEIDVIVVAIEYMSGDFYALLHDDRPVKSQLPEGKDPIEHAKYVVASVIDLSTSWLNPKIRSAKVDGDKVIVTYSCTVPFDSETLDEEINWKKIQDVSSDIDFYDELDSAIKAMY